mgnify:CR=1 FL=1
MTSKLKIQSEASWLEDGLKFHCTGCGKCCTGSPGFVWLSEEDIQRLSTFFQLEEKEFLKRYTRRIGKSGLHLRLRNAERIRRRRDLSGRPLIIDSPFHCLFYLCRTAGFRNGIGLCRHHQCAERNKQNWN